MTETNENEKVGQLPSSTVKTETKYWFNNSALSKSEKLKLPFRSFRGAMPDLELSFFIHKPIKCS